MEYILRVGHLGRARAGEPPLLTQYPRADIRLIGWHSLAKRIGNMERQFSEPDRPLRLTEPELQYWTVLSQQLAEAMDEQERRIAGGRSPKLLPSPDGYFQSAITARH